MDNEQELFIINSIYSLPISGGSFAQNLYNHLTRNTLMGILLQETLTQTEIKDLEHV